MATASMAVPEFDSDRLAPILDWLDREPADECAEDLEALCRYLALLTSASCTVGDVQRCLEPLLGRVSDIAERFRPRLLGLRLPLPRALHSANVQLIDALLDVGKLIDRVIEAAEDPPHAQDEAPALLAAYALKLVKEAFQLACMGAAEGMPRLWARAGALFSAGGRLDDSVGGVGGDAGDAAAAVTRCFKQMMAVAALQPESLTAREVAWVFDYLVLVGDHAELSASCSQPDSAVFWIDPMQDQPPVARVRRAPPAGSAPLYFRALGLVRRVAWQIDWLDRRIAEAEVVGLERDADLLEPEVSGLPLGLTPVEVLSLLRRMRERWTTPPNRTLPRRGRRYTVQVCQGLGAIWRMHRSGEAAASISEWSVFNESPGGYAIISVKAVDPVLGAGMAVALRRDTSQPWSICIVRWIRSDRGGEVELGLQVIAHGCTAVSVAFRGSDARATAAALLLPPLVARRRNPAILAPAGTYASRRFVLVREGAQLYVAQGRVLSLDLQTANVELFQYEIDPYAI